MKEQRERQERNRKAVAAEAYFPSRRKVGQESVPRKFSPIFLSFPQALLTGTSGFYSNWSSHQRENHFESGHGSRDCERGEKQLRLLTKGLHLSYSTQNAEAKYGTSQNPPALTLDLIIKSIYCSTWTNMNLKGPTKCLEEFNPHCLISLLRQLLSKDVVMSPTLPRAGQQHPSHFFVAMPPTSR